MSDTSDDMEALASLIPDESTDEYEDLLAENEQLRNSLRWAIRTVRLGAGSDPEEFARQWNLARAALNMGRP